MALGPPSPTGSYATSFGWNCRFSGGRVFPSGLPLFLWENARDVQRSFARGPRADHAVLPRLLLLWHCRAVLVGAPRLSRRHLHAARTHESAAFHVGAGDLVRFRSPTAQRALF